MGAPDDLSLLCTPPQICGPFPGVNMSPFPSFPPTHSSWRGIESGARSQTGFHWCDFKASMYLTTTVSEEGAHTPANVGIPSAVPLTCGCSAFMHIPPGTRNSLILEAAILISGLL